VSVDVEWQHSQQAGKKVTMTIDPSSPQPPAGQPQYLPTPEERSWGLLAHLSGLMTLLLIGGLSFIGPLVVWLVKKDQSPFIADQAKEALNFQIAATIAVYVSALSILVCVGIVLLPLVIIGAIVYSIIAAVEANKGVYYRYPYTFRFIS
jgi:uncharacterized Tic20 family protein